MKILEDVVDSLTYAYVVVFDMETIVVRGNVLHLGETDYKGTLPDQNTFEITKNYTEALGHTKEFIKIKYWN